MQRPHPQAPAFERRRGVARAGYTLLELCIVVALMGVMAAIAAPRYAQSRARYRVQASANRVAAELTAARSRARAAGAPAEVTFKVATSEFSVNGPWGATTTVSLDVEPYVSVLAATGFDGDVVRFDGFGTPSAAGKVKVQSEKMTCQVNLASDGSCTVAKPVLTTTRVRMGR